MIKLLVYRTEHGVEPYKEFLQRIKDPKAKSAVVMAQLNMERGLPGDVKSLGGGLKEKRIQAGAGYRIYFYNDGQDIIILLGGSSKKDQQREIENAKSYLKDYKRQKNALSKKEDIS
ncbi:type II toxin-antitoxin system RelE/ParE family toxin [Micavibrio aeruginosavorus]|uniref:Addiction module protein n=1 Tax=Micavibrio aeruginosavorus (strain ARL-13) TaxID=856793 RepID=G2KRU4_MICAA|nr:type II toxin-antitoxin system RelE/ParE family toxin [Micavibrio aeruginosavorus]AEP10052.1 conserved hypothetical protein [Micavibrio aeruginosavorus ARL-13]